LRLSKRANERTPTTEENHELKADPPHFPSVQGSDSGRAQSETRETIEDDSQKQQGIEKVIKES
jgi:hypothetical protein